MLSLFSKRPSIQEVKSNCTVNLKHVTGRKLWTLLCKTEFINKTIVGIPTVIIACTEMISIWCDCNYYVLFLFCINVIGINVLHGQLFKRLEVVICGLDFILFSLSDPNLCENWMNVNEITQKFTRIATYSAEMPAYRNSQVDHGSIYNCLCNVTTWNFWFSNKYFVTIKVNAFWLRIKK